MEGGDRECFLLPLYLVSRRGGREAIYKCWADALHRDAQVGNMTLVHIFLPLGYKYEFLWSSCFCLFFFFFQSPSQQGVGYRRQYPLCAHCTLITLLGFWPGFCLSVLDNLCNGKFHKHLQDLFAPLVVRYVDLMESSIAQSIHRGFERESWEPVK